MDQQEIIDAILVARDATLQSIGVWPEPTSPQDAVKMFIDKLADDLGLPIDGATP